jgi:DNA-binding response OmpR family regulator
MSADAARPILVVESDRHLGQAIAQQLIADGFNVELAHTAEHARILAGTSAPKLAVLGMLDSAPGALELLREIRAAGQRGTPWNRGLPAIVVGAHARELDMLRAFEAGADDFMIRPAAYIELRGFISSKDFGLGVWIFQVRRSWFGVVVGSHVMSGNVVK